MQVHRWAVCMRYLIIFVDIVHYTLNNWWKTEIDIGLHYPLRPLRVCRSFRIIAKAMHSHGSYWSLNLRLFFSGKVIWQKISEDGRVFFWVGEPLILCCSFFFLAQKFGVLPQTRFLPCSDETFSFFPPNYLHHRPSRQQSSKHSSWGSLHLQYYIYIIYAFIT